MSYSVFVVIVLFSMVAAGASSPAPPSPQPSLEEISHRLDMILNNTRSRENYIRCFMDRGICNKDALSIKKILVDALSTNCSNCTNAQRLGAERFFEYLQVRQPDTWVNLSGKYGGTRSEEDSDDDDDESDDDDDDERSKYNPNGKVVDQGKISSSKAGHNESMAVNSSAISIIF